MQELGYFKLARLSHIRYRGTIFWYEIATDWLKVAMWFGTYSCFGARMRRHGLARPLFVAKTTWFDIPNFCNAEEESVVLGVEDHEVRDGNNV